MAVQLDPLGVVSAVRDVVEVKKAEEKSAGDPNGDLYKNRVQNLQNIANGAVGDNRAMDEHLENFGVKDDKLDIAKLPQDLRGIADGAKTWGQLSEKAKSAGWDKLDSLLSAQVKGDFSKQEELDKLMSGSKTTAGIVIKDTAEGNLKKTKEAMKDLNVKEDAKVEDLVKHTNTNMLIDKPTTEKQLMQNYELAARGNVQATSINADAINAGKVKTADGKVIGKDTKVNWDLAGAETKKVAESYNDMELKDYNYGILEGRIDKQAAGAFDNSKSTIDKALANLETSLKDVWPDSAGNDRRTLLQTFDSIGQKLGTAADDIKKNFETLDKEFKKLENLDLSLPANREWLKERGEDLIALQEKTGKFAEKGSEYVSQATDNLGAIEKREEQERTQALLAVIFGGLATIGSAGMGLGNTITMNMKGGWGKLVKPGEKEATGLGLNGNFSIFANNAANTTTVGGLKLGALESAKSFLPSEFGSKIENTSTFMKDSWIKLSTDMARLDYKFYNWNRYENYMNWARQNADKSSIFGKGNDAGYDGPMPHKFWTDGEYKGKASDLYREVGPWRNRRYELKGPPEPEWYKK